MLPARIQPLHPSSPSHTTLSPSSSAEDLLSSFLPHLFPDEAPPCLGIPGQQLLYSSPRYGAIRVIVPDYNDDEGEKRKSGADVEAGRRLFAHYLWGGALVVAERVEEAEKEKEKEDGADARWRVSGETVMEVGA
ncbi:hypothetical protein LOZ49_006728, partial [Ophidiomyces ophidiicola]